MVTTYADAILDAHRFLLGHHPEVFVIGQGLWSPWYVGGTMTNLEIEFGKDRIIDTPVSEQACTGAALGASLCGYRAIVTHPRVDFALLAADQIVNQAAKWSSMFGGKARAPVTFRCIVNRGGEQGAQHSQSLHSVFAQIPGLRVVMPATPKDARDLFIASVLCDDPVVFLDDRFLYSLGDDLRPAADVEPLFLADEGPVVRSEGSDITLAGAGYSAQVCVEAAQLLAEDGISCEVVDVRIARPLRIDPIVQSVRKTGRLFVVDGDWRTCGFAGTIIAEVAEALDLGAWRSRPARATLADAPAPTSRALEKSYYPTPRSVACRVRQLIG